MTLGTKKQYAARGIPQPDGTLKAVTKAYLSKQRIAQMLKTAEETDPVDGKVKINFEKADKLFTNNRDPSKYIGKSNSAPPADQDDAGAGGENGSYESIRTNREQVKYEESLLNLLERKGETLPKRLVTDACAAAGQKIQEHLKSRNRRLAEKFATMSDSRQIKALMDEEDRLMLETVSNDLERKFQPAEGPGSAVAH